ncbi:hypothetical protein [Jejuia pallidilutea]|uniref:DUF4251 domain-containing protein n=2 Tax=Jejuia pallidilutea TaxID=504487 RepID=A0A098LMI6_9FLAO|nr:hypothetical protein [Jejuia pallidilutea]GAL88216.1 hypothetical protein JCM19538_2579 [Jejuia pallidilutea]
MIYSGPKIIAFFKLLAVCCCTVVCISCIANQEISASEKKSEIRYKPKIVFLNYSVKKNENNTKIVTFLNSKKVDGTLKDQKKILDKKGKLGDLVCTQLDASSSIVSQQLVKNPLKKTIEYVDETKNFKVVQMELDSSEFTVRLQLYPETKYIAINLNGAKQRPIALTKVSEL